MRRLLGVFFSGAFRVLVLPWTALGGAVGVALLPVMQGWLPPLFGVGIGLVIALVVGYFNVCQEADELRAKWDERDKWLAIAHRLGALGLDGKKLIPRSDDDAPSWTEINAWTTRVETYLQLNLGEGHKFLFSSGAGNEPKPPDYHRNQDVIARWFHVQARLMTLKKLVWTATKNADRIRPLEH